MSFSGVEAGNWAWERAAGTCTKQTILSKDYELFLHRHITVTHLCAKWQQTCMTYILKFNFHYKTIIMWFLIGNRGTTLCSCDEYTNITSCL